MLCGIISQLAATSEIEKCYWSDCVIRLVASTWTFNHHIDFCLDASLAFTCVDVSLTFPFTRVYASLTCTLTCV